jgi:hypothetical protein
MEEAMATIVPVQDKESGRLLGTLPRPRPVTFCECGDHAFTNLTKWGVTLVSPEDAHLLQANAWWMMDDGNGHCYAVRTTKGQKPIRLLQAPDGVDVDHEFGATLDNRRPRIRKLSRGNNNRNRRKPPTGASGYRGVTLHKASGLYRAYYWLDGKQKSAGYFRDKLSAAQARDRACAEHIGPIQTLNFNHGGSHDCN